MPQASDTLIAKLDRIREDCRDGLMTASEYLSHIADIFDGSVVFAMEGICEQKTREASDDLPRP